MYRASFRRVIDFCPQFKIIRGAGRDLNGRRWANRRAVAGVPLTHAIADEPAGESGYRGCVARIGVCIEVDIRDLHAGEEDLRRHKTDLYIAGLRSGDLETKERHDAEFAERGWNGVAYDSRPRPEFRERLCRRRDLRLRIIYRVSKRVYLYEDVIDRERRDAKRHAKRS